MPRDHRVNRRLDGCGVSAKSAAPRLVRKIFPKLICKCSNEHYPLQCLRSWCFFCWPAVERSRRFAGGWCDGARIGVAAPGGPGGTNPTVSRGKRHEFAIPQGSWSAATRRRLSVRRLVAAPAAPHQPRHTSRATPAACWWASQQASLQKPTTRRRTPRRAARFFRVQLVRLRGKERRSFLSPSKTSALEALQHWQDASWAQAEGPHHGAGCAAGLI